MSPHRRKPILINSGRHPFETWPLFCCALVGGVMGAVPSMRPPSMVRILHEEYVTVWLVMLALGGLAGLIGGHWRGDVETGLIVEAGGVLVIACMCSVYIMALAAFNAGAAFTAGGLLAGIGIGAWHRFGQIMFELRKVNRAQVAEKVTADVPLLVEPEPDPPEPDPGSG